MEVNFKSFKTMGPSVGTVNLSLLRAVPVLSAVLG